MATQPQPQVTQEQEAALLEKARGGDHDALGSLVQPWRRTVPQCQSMRFRKAPSC